jgi:hypothetical protein
MPITKVVLAFFSIGFLAGSFERAAGLGDPERPKRMADRYVDASVAHATDLVLASVGPMEGISKLMQASARGSAGPALGWAGAAWPGFEGGPMRGGDGLSILLFTTQPLNPDLWHRQLAAKRMLSEPDVVRMSKLPAPISFAPADEWAKASRYYDTSERAGGGPTQEFIMPFEHGRVSSLFNQGRYHPAIDLAGALGSTVSATTRRQRVTFAGWRGGYGNAVITRDDFGRTHLYGHLLRIFARVGTVLDQGQKLGALGSTGHSTGPHVHYEVRAKSGAHINPVTLLFPGRRVGLGFAWNGAGSVKPGATAVAQAHPRPR